MDYAYVKDGVVVSGPVRLPKSWGNYSGFNFLDNESLKELGWLPWVRVESNIEKSNLENFKAEKIIEIKDDKVVEYVTYVERSREEIFQEYNLLCENVRELRREQYKIKTDGIFFEVQRGEKNLVEWEIEVNNIKLLYPFPEPPEL